MRTGACATRHCCCWSFWSSTAPGWVALDPNRCRMSSCVPTPSTMPGAVSPVRGEPTLFIRGSEPCASRSVPSAQLVCTTSPRPSSNTLRTPLHSNCAPSDSGSWTSSTVTQCPVSLACLTTPPSLLKHARTPPHHLTAGCGRAQPQRVLPGAAEGQLRVPRPAGQGPGARRHWSPPLVSPMCSFPVSPKLFLPRSTVLVSYAS